MALTIILIGPLRAGKFIFAVLLAEKLGLRRVEIDVDSSYIADWGST
jgi:shikimate kinase